MSTGGATTTGPRPVVERRELETTGVLPIPETERTLGARQLMFVWMMSQAGVTAPLMGFLLYGVGPRDFLIIIGISFLIGFLPAAALSELGRRLAITSLVFARDCFGAIGTLPIALLLACVSLGFFGLTSAAIASIIAAATRTSARYWDAIVGVTDILLVLVGMRLVERCHRWTRIVVPLSYIGLLVFLSERFGLHLPSSSGDVKWGPAITLVTTASLLSWGYILPTVSRFCRPWAGDLRRHNLAFSLAPSLGIITTVTCLGLFGMVGVRSAGTWNIAARAAAAGGWPLIFGLLLASAAIPSTAMNIYSGAMSLLAAQTTVYPQRRWHQPAMTVVLGLAGTTLAEAGILDHAKLFLDDSSIVLVPFTFLLVTDWLWVKRRAADVAIFYPSPSGGFRVKVVWRALAILAIGVAIAGVVPHVAPHGFTDNVPVPIAAGLISALCYIVVTWPRSPGARCGSAVLTEVRG